MHVTRYPDAEDLWLVVTYRLPQCEGFVGHGRGSSAVRWRLEGWTGDSVREV